MPEIALEARSLRKSFGGIHAVRDVSVQVDRGEVLGLVGENGAGKSTLINILSGIFPADAGEICVEGQPVVFEGPGDALRAGIYAVHQELNLVPDLPIIDNIFLGQERMLDRMGLVTDRRRMKGEAAQILAQLQMADVDPSRLVRTLGMGQQQLVEVSKALVHHCRILILDEPTSSLTESDAKRLFRIVAQLKQAGVAVVYISHKLDEVMAICDRVSVLRDGQLVATKAIGELSVEEIVRHMVGRTLSAYFPPRNAKVGVEALRVEGLRSAKLRGLDLRLHYGEVVGLAGLVGSGRTELARALFGLDRVTGGKIWLDEKLVRIGSATDAVRRGIAFITEDRKSEGLVLPMSVEFNTNLAALQFGGDRGFIRTRHLREMASRTVADLNVKPGDIGMPCRNLSGGNQQKVVVGKWLNCNARVFIFDEPTRGIDVGSKVEVYRLMNRLAESGAAILMISSEIEEIIGMSDRVYIMHDGTFGGELRRGEVTPERVMFAATGQMQEAGPAPA